jgi:hypothetical protein
LISISSRKIPMLTARPPGERPVRVGESGDGEHDDDEDHQPRVTGIHSAVQRSPYNPGEPHRDEVVFIRVYASGSAHTGTATSRRSHGPRRCGPLAMQATRPYIAYCAAADIAVTPGAQDSGNRAAIPVRIRGPGSSR